MGRPSLLWVVLGVYEKSKLSKPREASKKRQQPSLTRLQILPPVLALDLQGCVSHTDPFFPELLLLMVFIVPTEGKLRWARLLVWGYQQ